MRSNKSTDIGDSKSAPRSGAALNSPKDGEAVLGTNELLVIDKKIYFINDIKVL